MRWRRPPKPPPAWHKVSGEPFRPVVEDEATVDVVVPFEIRPGGEDLPIRWGPGPKRVNEDESDR